MGPYAHIFLALALIAPAACKPDKGSPSTAPGTIEPAHGIEPADDGDGDGDDPVTEGGAPAAEEEEEDPSGDYTARFLQLVQDQCVGCHNPGGFAAASDFSTYDSLAAWAASPYVVPGKPLESKLYTRLQYSEGDGDAKDMPQGLPFDSDSAALVRVAILLMATAMGPTPPPDWSFDPETDQVRILPFRTRLDKLRHLAGDPATSTAARYDKLLAARFVLGEYDFAHGIPEQRLWGDMQIQTWSEAVDEFCADQAVQDRFPWPAKFDDLIWAAYGRAPTADDATLKADIEALAVDDADKTAVACIAVTSSLEFHTRTPSASATPLTTYANLVANALLHRPLDAAEATEASSLDGVRSLLQRWLDTPAFSGSVRQLAETMLRTNGVANGVDYDAPARIVVKVAEAGLPHATILTRATCVSAAGDDVACDSEAPFGAGVLTTRAFLVSTGGPYNIRRATQLHKTFACGAFPLPEAQEPRVERSALIPTFAASTGTGFGNGTDCYVCHSQIGKHAQLFVRFDADGFYQPEATGLQSADPLLPAGHGDDLLFASHFADPQRAASEASTYLDREVANLRDAANALTKSPQFLTCSVAGVLGHYLGLSDVATLALDDGLLDDITAAIKARNADPSLKDIIQVALTHPAVVESFTASSTGESGE